MLWKPRASYSINSNMQKFLNHIALRYDLPGNDYRTVHGWSIENTKEFWAEIWDYCNVIYSKNYESYIYTGIYENKFLVQLCVSDIEKDIGYYL